MTDRMSSMEYLERLKNKSKAGLIYECFRLQYMLDSEGIEEIDLQDARKIMEIYEILR